MTGLLFLAYLASVVANAESSGKQVYETRCASCHDARARERTPSREALGRLTRERILEVLETGVMRDFGKVLAPAERLEVASFLSQITVEKPKANACASNGWRVGPPEWRGWGGSEANTRYQTDAGLKASDVPRLKLLWAFGFENTSSASVQPVVFGDRVFVGSFNKQVYSLDAATGCTHWIFKADAPVRASVSVGELRGEALAWFGDLSGNVYAVDARDGKQRWKRRVHEHPDAMITGSPLLLDGRLYVPVSSREEWRAMDSGYHCCSFRGSVVALDAKSGKVLWKSYTVPKNRSGGAVWVAPTADRKRGLLFVGTGNAYTAPAADTVDSVIAISLKTGARRWHYSFNSGDAWNFACAGKSNRSNCPESTSRFTDTDVASPAILASPDVLIASYNLGLFAFDLAHGYKHIWRKPIGAHPGFQQVRNGQAVVDNRLYASVTGGFLPNKSYDPNIGGGVFAFDLSNGELRWHAEPGPCEEGKVCFAGQPAAVTAIPGILFTGALDGRLSALALADGHKVWEFDTHREFTTVNGLKALGGSLGFAGVAVAGGRVFVGSGYDRADRPYAGNVLLSFGVE